MARTPLVDGLQRAAARAAADADGTTRRAFLAQTGTLAAGAAVATWPVRPAFAASAQPRIVVVGAGLAGLTAAYRLQQAGYEPQLHEASTRAGGRCWSIRDVFADGQIAEHGGELVDSNHIAMKQLVSELGLQLDNLFQAEQAGTEPITFFDGRPYTWDAATNDLKAIWQQIHADVSAASYPTTYRSATQRGRELDAMSIAAWLARYVPGGASSKLARLLDVAYNIEYGAETSDQASLNMLYLLGYAGQGNLRIFGKSNEKYHVRGGNDQVTQGLATRVGGALRYGSELVAVAANADGTHTLSFRQGAKTVSTVADRAILALPFSLLRSVDLSKAAFGTRKRWAIDELGMGTNSKLNLGFSRRHWRTLGNNGDSYADTGYQATWEVSRAQPGTAGILVDYTGGQIGTTFGAGTPQDLARRFLGQIEPVLPGITGAWDGRATVDAWPTQRWTKGSYSYFRVGQYTRFSGAEAEVSGTCHFAGEHTSQDFQGYLNGAVESGQRAASEVLAALKK
ncbi:MAG TPA: NAD(P)/FAD-dependent oxidoreductase [Baekduia sp.]|uniref:flavin monoamine oxidase family protein n=1 Tax=Baekduia sp. TaxID=2600305 RepID=UPI002CADF3C4|nr:NAD(P)/FAD-dependent oxidoreductase [Baekduia sp.]HMJ37066.1 NAD(P)/FAD-dependent oxidoreductase [Baekduia sp.]